MSLLFLNAVHTQIMLWLHSAQTEIEKEQKGFISLPKDLL